MEACYKSLSLVYPNRLKPGQRIDNLLRMKRAMQKLHQTLTKISFLTGGSSRGSTTDRPDDEKARLEAKKIEKLVFIIKKLTFWFFSFSSVSIVEGVWM